MSPLTSDDRRGKQSTSERQWLSTPALLGRTVRGVGKVLKYQDKRVAAGLIIGSIAGLVWRAVLRGGHAAAVALKLWANAQATSDLASCYLALSILLLGVTLIVLPFLLLLIRRYFLAWWVGIISATWFVTAVSTASVIAVWPSFESVSRSVGVLIVIVTLVVESWRKARGLSPNAPGRLELPVRPSPEVITRSKTPWVANWSDDPIASWKDDVLRRQSVVETLTDYALVHKAPIIALNGRLGDGKSSVLNLFGASIESRAIAVSFSAWLPGSEAALATDIFNDIARECRKRIYVPRLRRQGLAFARAISGSAPHLSGLKELIPKQSQNEEIAELAKTLGRLPKRIVVLVDEVDRMHREELLVLLKILRGVVSIPNVSFVCAFDEQRVAKVLNEDREYLEKFFPVSVKLSAPSDKFLSISLRTQLKGLFETQGWFAAASDVEGFSDLLEKAWPELLRPLTTNLRQAGLLWRDISVAGKTVVLEVDPLDLVLISVLRRYFPMMHERVRGAAKYLVSEDSSSSGITAKERSDFFKSLESLISEHTVPAAVRGILCWLFPEFEKTCLRGFAERRPILQPVSSKRICEADYFQIYFFGTVSDEVFSHGELSKVIVDLDCAASEDNAKSIFNTVLDSMEPGDPRRSNFMFRLAHEMHSLQGPAAGYLAYAASARAADYDVSFWSGGEDTWARRIIFAAAQKVSGSPAAQMVLEGAMVRATDENFAVKLLEYTEKSDQNLILTNYSSVKTPELGRVFAATMRKRYEQPEKIDISRANHWALRKWLEISNDDREFLHDALRVFIGQSRQKLAQVVNVLYPARGVWSFDPTSIINDLFPIETFRVLMRDLPLDDNLDEVELKGIERLDKLFLGKYPTPSEPTV